jgi:HEPN domain-containing protein
MSFTLNLSEEEFNQLMEEIDALMASQGVNIPAREIRGWMLFCQRQQFNGISMTHPISEKVMAWFKTKYGERLNLDGSFGYSAVLLRNDVIRFRCPVFFGRLLAICSSELMGHDFGGVKVNQPAMLNILDQMGGLTTAFANSLTPVEKGRLLEEFVASEKALACVADAEPQPYIAEARGDLRTSIEQLTMPQPQYGPSKYSSLQATEKFLKSYIVQRRSEHKFTHNISELADKAEGLGLRTLDRGTLRAIECLASVRYDTELVSKSEAVGAHKAAISICAEIASQLPNRSGWKTTILSNGTIKFQSKNEEIRAVQLSRVK